MINNTKLIFFYYIYIFNYMKCSAGCSNVPQTLSGSPIVPRTCRQPALVLIVLISAELYPYLRRIYNMTLA